MRQAKIIFFEREKKPNNGSCGEKLAATKIEKEVTKGKEGDISAIVSAPKGGEQEAFLSIT